MRTQVAAGTSRSRHQASDTAAIEPAASTDELIIHSLHALARSSEISAQNQAAVSLAQDRRYYCYLLDPEILTAEESVAVARNLAAIDTRFIVGFVKAVDTQTDSERISRGLAILHALGKTNLAVPWIRRMTEHANPYIRSRAVNLLCRLHVNPQLIEKQLESEDPRVRANAIEALWGADTWISRRLLERAADDKHHRVSANALLGLYLARIPDSVERLLLAARNASALVRAGAAWAMGQTRDKIFVPHLEQLRADSEEKVRSSAERALQFLATGV